MGTQTTIETRQEVGPNGEIITVRRKITKTTVVRRSVIEDDDGGGGGGSGGAEDSPRTKNKSGGCCSWLFSCFGGSKSKAAKELPDEEAGPIAEGDAAGYERDCLKWHNHYRAMHGCGPLTINSKLTALAQDWANKLAKKGYMEHRDNCEYGENIYTKWSSDPSFNISGKDPCAQWYSEIKFLASYGRDPNNLEKVGHFTQLVWKDTKEVGIARSKSSSNKIFVVANYNPAGNVIGQFGANVLPPK